jgi:hypothetical protein
MQRTQFHRLYVHVFLCNLPANNIPFSRAAKAPMALEDAKTLAYVLTRLYAPDFSSTKSAPASLMHAWNSHRQRRIAKVMDFTTKNGDLRKSSPHFYEQAAKEWIIWAVFKWAGPDGGAGWMYEYPAESVLGDFPQ